MERAIAAEKMANMTVGGGRTSGKAANWPISSVSIEHPNHH